MKGAAQRREDGQHRNTPETVLVPTRKFMRIGLDPCSNEWSTVGARIEYRQPNQNGLELPWVTRLQNHRYCGPGKLDPSLPYEGVFCNAVWANLLPWVRKTVEEHERDKFAHIIFYAHFDPSTKWGGEIMDACSAFALWRKRLNHPLFGQESRGADRPTCSWYLGGYAPEFCEHFKPYARCFKK